MTHITKHAGHRIEVGDKNGKRTVLSAEQILERLSGDDAFKVGSEHFFWSEEDNCCLMVITKSQGLVLVTVYEPTRGYAPWMPMLARFRRLRRPVFEQVAVTSRSPLESAGLWLVDRKPNQDIEEVKRLTDMLVLWHDFPSPRCATFWSKEFHESAASLICDYVTDAEPSKQRRKRLYLQICGNGWTFLCPAYVPFELLEITSPLD